MVVTVVVDTPKGLSEDQKRKLRDLAPQLGLELEDAQGAKKGFFDKFKN